MEMVSVGSEVVEAVNLTTLERKTWPAAFTFLRIHRGSLKLKLSSPPYAMISDMRFWGQLWYSNSVELSRRCTVLIWTAQQPPDVPFSTGSSIVRYDDSARRNSAHDGGRVNTLTIPCPQAYRAKIPDAPLMYFDHCLGVLAHLRHRGSELSIKGPIAEVSVSKPCSPAHCWTQDLGIPVQNNNLLELCGISLNRSIICSASSRVRYLRSLFTTESDSPV